MQKKLAKGLEGKVLKQKLDTNVEKISENIKEGTKLEHDMVMLKNQIDAIYNSDLAPGDKAEQIRIIKEGMNLLNVKHGEIDNVIKEYQKEGQEIVDTLQENVKTLEKQKVDMTNAKLESGVVDFKQVLDATEKRQTEFSSYAQEYKARLQASIDVMNAQKRNMLKNQFKQK